MPLCPNRSLQPQQPGFKAQIEMQQICKAWANIITCMKRLTLLKWEAEVFCSAHSHWNISVISAQTDHITCHPSYVRILLGNITGSPIITGDNTTGIQAQGTRSQDGLPQPLPEHTKENQQKFLWLEHSPPSVPAAFHFKSSRHVERAMATLSHHNHCWDSCALLSCGWGKDSGCSLPWLQQGLWYCLPWHSPGKTGCHSLDRCSVHWLETACWKCL